MTNLFQWFQYQLTASAEGFIWAIEQVPEERRTIHPPEGLGEWSAARHVFHMMYYEEGIAMPSMQQWLGQARPLLEGKDEDLTWGENQKDVASLLAEFRKIRQRVKLEECADDR